MTKAKPFAPTLSKAEFKSKVVSALRQLSRFWKPKQEAIWRARIKRGVYRCELCKTEWPASLPPLKGKKRKRKNINADHIIPIVWVEWFTSYDNWIERCFVPAEGYQAICWDCHSEKTKEENEERRQYKLKQKLWTKKW